MEQGAAMTTRSLGDWPQGLTSVHCDDGAGGRAGEADEEPWNTARLQCRQCRLGNGGEQDLLGAPQGPVPEISWSCFIDCLAGHVSEYCLELCEFCEDPWGCAICAGCAGIWVGVCTWRCLF
jgi:hypothetical protein